MSRRGFFSSSAFVAPQPMGTLPKCGSCGLFKLCRSPKMVPSGEGRRGILILGEAPGENEDLKGVQFIGKAGGVLERALRRIGIKMRRDCWLTNSLICRPPKNKTPNEKQIDYCRPNLVKTIKDLNPTVIIPLGAVACKSLLGWVWRDDVGSITRWAGWQIPCQKLNAWICPTFHPSYLNREKNPVLDRFFAQHLAAAVEHDKRPWDEVKPFKDQVEVITDVDDAAKILRKFTARGGPISFDFETNMLKPDSELARIVCCSVCWRGKRTIAYPWHGAAIRATRELLLSDCPKIGANQKFEQRWCIAEMGIRIHNWVWDCMINAHILDNRKEITSVKFQAFALLGQESYNQHLEVLLAAKGSANKPNRIKEIGLRDLLLYCGIDALCEYLIGIRQMRQMGYKLAR